MYCTWFFQKKQQKLFNYFCYNDENATCLMENLVGNCNFDQIIKYYK